jgi:hypothetical protein
MQNVLILQASQVALDSAPGRALEFVHKVQDLGQVSFDAVPDTPLSPAEQDALRWMTYLEAGPDEVSFSAGDQSAAELEEANRQFQGVMERMLQQVTHYAWVETLLDGRFLAQSVVGWGGNLQTLWGKVLEPDDFQMHRLALRQALATRHILVRACVATTQSAAKLALLLTNPAGAVMALPVAWKMVRQILTDIEEYQRVTSQ